MSPRALRTRVEKRLLTNSRDYQDYGSISNPGLVLSRYLIDQRAGEEGRDDASLPATATKFLLAKVSQARIPYGYELAYQRWRSTLMERNDVRLDIFGSCGRIAVGIGETSVLETSLALRHPWGMPYIPGSALKGLAASYLRNVASGEDDNLKPPKPCLDDQGNPVLDQDGKPRIDPNAYSVLFGTDQSAAFVIWHEAWFVPDAGTMPFHEDVITIHHPGYYQSSKTNAEPTDFDDPTPIPFLSVSGSFLIALQGPTEWTDVACEVLKRALEHAGIGAKTNAGYGRLIHQKTEHRYVPPKGPDDEIRDLIQEIEKAESSSVGRLAPEWVQAWTGQPEGDLRRLLAMAIFAKVQTNPRVLNRRFREPGNYGTPIYQYLRELGEVE